MKTLKKTLCLALALLMLASCLVACAKDPDPVNTKTCTYEEMVAYLTAKGYIAKDAKPVNINETEGYVTDNTGGEIPFVEIADKAEDYDGLWLFWWKEGSDLYNNIYVNMAANAGTIVFMGGAAVISTDAQNGYFAIAFGENYAKKDAVLADFNALPNK